MINVISNERNTIHYLCDCGTRGKCTIKPRNENAAIVFDVRCPNCLDTERMTIIQYSSEEIKEAFLKELNRVDLSWVPTFNEEIEE